MEKAYNNTSPAFTLALFHDTSIIILCIPFLSNYKVVEIHTYNFIPS
jgi:hypothetical protein